MLFSLINIAANHGQKRRSRESGSVEKLRLPLNHRALVAGQLRFTEDLPGAASRCVIQRGTLLSHRLLGIVSIRDRLLTLPEYRILTTCAAAESENRVLPTTAPALKLPAHRRTRAGFLPRIAPSGKTS